jgi:hypothetical protein
MIKLNKEEIKTRNKKIVKEYQSECKKADVNKTAFCRLREISTRTLGRILEAAGFSAEPTKKVVAKSVSKKSTVVTKAILTPNPQVVETKQIEIPIAVKEKKVEEPKINPNEIISWTVTKDRFISVLLDNGEPLSVESSHPDYSEIIHNLAIGKYEEALHKMSIKHMLEAVKIGGFEVTETKLLFNGVKVESDLVSDILSMFKREEPIDHMLKFFENLMKSPSTHMYKHLWKLISNAGVTITPEGNVECFKLVNNNFMDIRTGKISNRVGDTVTMLRSEVDDNYNNTCSHGLHVCARQYITDSNYGNGQNGGNILVKVLVTPQDFVAIPPDYEFTKARTCGYTVLSVVKD